jgi:hypothetical protein
MAIIDKYDPELQDLVSACLFDNKMFDKTFFPEEVKVDFSILHDKIFEVLDANNKKKAIAAPRGLGKTTLAKLRVIKAILFREVNFIIYLSNSATSAEMQTEAIKRLLQQSDLVQKYFGDVKFSKTGMKDSFSKQSWVAYGDVFVLPRGAGQQVRGLNWLGHRPGLIVIDDLESKELVKSDEQREKLSEWFYSDLMKTESKFGTPAEFIYIDTIKHEDALLQNLIKASDWLTVDTPDKVLSICDQNFNSYDDNYMTTEEIKLEYTQHQEKGKTDLFYMEYMNIPISLEDAIFKPEFSKYYTECGSYLEVVQQLNTQEKEEIIRIDHKELITVVICDPARTVKLQSAESALVVVSVCRKNGMIFIRYPWAEKVRPDDLYEQMFHLVLMYNATLLAVEETGLSEFIRQPIQNEMHKRGVYPTYISLNAKGDKDTRIASALSPLYKLGYMYHNKENCQALENQLKWHPKSKRKDIIDALSYISYIMETHAMYFDPDDIDNDFEDEFSELYDDPTEEYIQLI